VRGIALCLWLLAGSASADTYRCFLDNRPINRDRPIAECAHLTQEILHSDGSIKGVLKPPLTLTEKLRHETEAAAAAVAAGDARAKAMRERALLNKYPTKADHDWQRQVEIAEAQRKIGRHQGA
jgi:hypothetical protein